MRVFIDGENFRHQIAHVLKYHNKVSDNNHYFPFDWIGFLSEVLHTNDIDATYYTTQIELPHKPIPSEMQHHIDAIVDANAQQLVDLADQGIKVVLAGHLRVRESNTSWHSDKRSLVLQEKGVDVRVAIDIVLAGQHAERDLVLVSSDSDMSPALSALKTTHAQVTYLCYAGWLNHEVAAGADKTTTFDDDLVLKYYRGK